jgi:hypothetical protein
MSSQEGEGDQSPTAQMLTDEAIDGITIFEATKQRREAIGLIVQGKHRLMHKCERGAARFS